MHTIRPKKLLTLAHNESGATAIVFALALTVLCGFVALALDVGHLVMAKAELQRTADAAALAGAMGLLPYIDTGTPTPNWTQGQSKAHTIISNAANQVDNYNFSITDGTVLYGYWLLNPPAGYAQIPLSTVRTSTVAYLPEPAVNVTLSRNVTLYFAPVVGVSSPTTVSATATAILPEDYQTTGLPPIAIDYNTVYNAIGGNTEIDVLTQDIKIQSNKGIAGWFNLIGDNSVPSVRIGTPLTSPTSQIYLVPGAKATLTDFMTQGETVIVPVVQTVSQNTWAPIIGFAAFQIDPDGLASNSITGHFVDQYFDPNVVPVAGTPTTAVAVAGTPKLVSP
jgi:Flp pilus assembly protein TadG